MKKDATRAVQRGAQHRKSVARTELGHWDAAQRTADPRKLLAKATRGRVAALIPLKNERMAASAFAFFRGAAPIMAFDLSLAPHTPIICQLCGDAHVQNLGAYEGDDGRLIFDINDFDETIRGPFEWDIKRMTTSILLAGDDAGVHKTGCHGAADIFLASYCSLMEQLARLPVLEAARFQVHRLHAVSSISEILRKAERSTPLHTREHLTEETARGRVFRNLPPVLHRVKGERKRVVLASLRRYRESLQPERQHFLARYKPLDVAFKVVGTGSVGMRDYVVYMEGNGADDPLFLQIKEETSSVYSPYLSANVIKTPNHGQRVVNGHRAMQLQSDPMLGYTRFEGRDYLVRQLNDHKATLDVTHLDEAGLQQYAEVCGELLARGHARSGDPGLIQGYIGKGRRFREAMLEFAHAYATQSRDDWEKFRAGLA
ncbi:DUF2252 domain-containing protein [Terriglobus albidus]|uniref:DUF2252 domain-containing protein n=1 Tax=Terriglobus albidus TaxID=1592106 RepID=A0A5B9E7X8_9BACT|nr:DUF2252 domain-containing protein [Terriglobus albidus]QEE26730.1 DUF2252 domain-containing protein [Terriglobus albidus]